MALQFSSADAILLSVFLIHRKTSGSGAKHPGSNPRSAPSGCVPLGNLLNLPVERGEKHLTCGAGLLGGELK